MSNRWFALSAGLAAMAVAVIFAVHASVETYRAAAGQGLIRISVIAAIGLVALGLLVAFVAILRTLLTKGHIAWYIAAVLNAAAAVVYVSQVRDWGFAALLVVVALEVVAARLMRPARHEERRDPPAADAA